MTLMPLPMRSAESALVKLTMESGARGIPSKVLFNPRIRAAPPGECHGFGVVMDEAQDLARCWERWEWG